MKARSDTGLIGGGAVGLGVLAALAVAVPAVVGAQVIDSARDGRAGAWLFAVLGLIVVGFAVGGHVAARRRPAVPLLNGVATGIAAYAVVQTLAIVRLLINGDEVTWAAVPLFVLVAAAAGLVGALVADARTPRR